MHPIIALPQHHRNDGLQVHPLEVAQGDELALGDARAREVEQAEIPALLHGGLHELQPLDAAPAVAMGIDQAGLRGVLLVVIVAVLDAQVAVVQQGAVVAGVGLGHLRPQIEGRVAEAEGPD